MLRRGVLAGTAAAVFVLLCVALYASSASQAAADTEARLQQLGSQISALSSRQLESHTDRQREHDAVLEALGRLDERFSPVLPSDLRRRSLLPAHVGKRPARHAHPAVALSRGWQFPVDANVARGSLPPMTASEPQGLSWGEPLDECVWRFDGYAPSEGEARWRNEALAKDPWRICAPFLGPFRAEHDAYIGELGKCVPHVANTSAAAPEHCDQNPPRRFHDVFSLMKYKRTCNGSTEEQSVAIEPLVGMLRHPTVCEDFYPNLFNKNYMVLEAWNAHRNRQVNTKAGRPPRNFFFDLGASTYNAGLGGASQSWFMSVFEDICIMWDRVWAWEATQHESTKVWEEIPGYLHGRYHWYNVPCSSDVASWANPWNTLLSVATPEDYVVVKLDIDTWQVENPLVDQILSTPALRERIDEFFYEHHVRMEKIEAVWRTAVDRAHNAADSVDMFSRLRKGGIHAHSWV
jgi:hypothetical protein